MEQAFVCDVRHGITVPGSDISPYNTTRELSHSPPSALRSGNTGYQGIIPAGNSARPPTITSFLINNPCRFPLFSLCLPFLVLSSSPPHTPLTHHHTPPTSPTPATQHPPSPNTAPLPSPARPTARKPVTSRNRVRCSMIFECWVGGVFFLLFCGVGEGG